MRGAGLGFLAATLLALTTAASAGQLTVGAGAAVDLGTGSLGLGCADLTVTGTLLAGNVGFTGGRDITIDPAGVVNGNSGTLQLSGDWDNSGTFNAGTSSVQIVDGCSLLSGVVFGSTTFAGLSITSTSSRLVSFQAGSTTTVTGGLTLAGQSGALLAIRSMLGGSPAFLAAFGTTSGQFVDVDDNDATGGNAISLGPESVMGPNTPGWKLATLVPVLTPIGLLAVALALLWLGQRSLGFGGRLPG
jgi:hypothetical protein